MKRRLCNVTLVASIVLSSSISLSICVGAMPVPAGREVGNKPHLGLKASCGTELYCSTTISFFFVLLALACYYVLTYRL